MYHNPNTGLNTYFLTFSNGSKLEIMTRPGVDSFLSDTYSLGYFPYRVFFGEPGRSVVVASNDSASLIATLLLN